MKILMVCLGNICRSPMAEGILRHKAEAAGLDIEIDSCGTGGWHTGESPDQRAQQKMREKGIDISGLRARQLHPTDFETFDLIYTMDESNFSNTVAMANRHIDKVRMILNELHPDSNMPVPDPYYGGESGFEDVFQLLNDACAEIIRKIQNGETR